MRTGTIQALGRLFIGSYAWASVPSAATAGAGAIVEVNDVGNRPVLMRSDGSNWRPLGVQTIYSNTVNSNYTGSTTAQILISVLIPGNFFHPNAQIRITFSGGRSAGTGGNVTVIVRVGANNTSATAIYSNGGTSAVQRNQRDLLFQNSRSSQISPSPGNSASFAAGGSAPADLALNFASDQYITFGVTLANAADTGTFYQALIEYVG